MAIRALVSVAGYDFPEPSTYKGITADLVDAGRNVQGITIGDIVRSDVAKVELTWRFLTTDQWASVLQCFKPSAGGSFYNAVTFFDQTTGDWATRTMYVSDRTAEIFLRDAEGNIKGWVNPSLSLVEK